MLGAVPASRLATATGGAGSSTTAQVGASNMTSLEAIRSDLGARQTERGTVVSLPGDVLFAFDKAEITPAARPTLDKLAQLVGADAAAKVAIEGHTDSKGDDSYNLRLSERRAQAVRDYLKDVRSVAGDRMIVKGLGEARPVAQNMTPDGRDNPSGQERNRRVEVIIGAS